jgi:hypothetical protein
MSMDQKEALASLETIRNILERSTHYTHIAPGGLIAAGAVAVVSSAVGAQLGLGPERPQGFLVLWGLTLLAAMASGVGASAHRAWRRGETFFGRKLQFVAAGFGPPAVGAAVLTAALYDVQRLDLCPGVWMLFYGTAILTVGVVLDWEFRAAAWAFLVAGSAALFVFRDHPHLSLGFAFGGLHLSLGAFRLVMEGVDSWRARTPSFESRT